MKRRIRQIIWCSVFLTGGAGCSSPYQNAVTDIPARKWSEAIEIRMENADTLTLRDAALFLRCNDRFTEDTLTVRIATLSPDSLRFEESFLLAITRKNTPAALMHEYLIPYRRRIRLSRTGEYRLVVTPERSVRGVEAVGIRLSKSN